MIQYYALCGWVVDVRTTGKNILPTFVFKTKLLIFDPSEVGAQNKCTAIISGKVGMQTIAILRVYVSHSHAAYSAAVYFSFTASGLEDELPHATVSAHHVYNTVSSDGENLS